MYDYLVGTPFLPEVAYLPFPINRSITTQYRPAWDKRLVRLDLRLCGRHSTAGAARKPSHYCRRRLLSRKPNACCISCRCYHLQDADNNVFNPFVCTSTSGLLCGCCIVSCGTSADGASDAQSALVPVPGAAIDYPSWCSVSCGKMTPSKWP